MILQVLHCEDRSTHTITNDPRVTAHFATLAAFCTAYPLGAGLFCRETAGGAFLDLRRPVSYVFTNLGHLGMNLVMLCSRACSCEDIGPEDPDIREPNRPQIPSSHLDEEDEQGAANAQITEPEPIFRTTSDVEDETDRPYTNSEHPYTTCDGRLYGRPQYQDCEQALQTYPDYSLRDTRLTREFLGAGVHSNGDENLGTVQTPLILVSGK